LNEVEIRREGSRKRRRRGKGDSLEKRNRQKRQHIRALVWKRGVSSGSKADQVSNIGSKGGETQQDERKVDVAS